MDVRDKTLSTLVDRLDEMAFTLTEAVNGIHQQGFNRYGQQGVDFFKRLGSKDRAAEFIDLSEMVKDNSNGHPYWQWCASVSTDACANSSAPVNSTFCQDTDASCSSACTGGC